METNDLFSFLFEQCYNDVYKFTYLLARDEEIAKDAVQEAFCEGLVRFKTLKDISKFRAWIISISSNKAIDIMRKNARNIPSKNMDQIAATYAEEPVYEIIKKEDEDKILRLLNKLEDKYRKIIILKYCYELPEEEIATILQLPKGTVKSRLYRSRKKLKDMLNGLEARGEGQ